MTLSLHTIKSTKGTAQKRKRIGRGNASGTGTYSGKGLKGQNARAGVSNLKRLGMKQVLLRTPKSRGFKSLKPKNQIVSLTAISDNFKDSDTVSPKTLLEKGLVDTTKVAVKVLGNGTLKLNGLKFSNVLVSESAKKQLQDNKCKIENKK